MNDNVLGQQPNENHVAIVMKIWTASVDVEREDQDQVPDRVTDVLDHVIVALDHVNVKNIAAGDRY